MGWVEGGIESATSKESGIMQQEEESGLKTDWENSQLQMTAWIC